MTLVNLLNKQVFVARQATAGGDPDKLAFTTVTATMANIQPMADYKSAIATGVHGKMHRCWVDGCVDIQDSDRLRDTSGKYYTVINGGVSRRTQGSIDYLEVWMQETET